MAIITPKIKYGNINKGNIRFLIKTFIHKENGINIR